jgi:hypothetical protein
MILRKKVRSGRKEEIQQNPLWRNRLSKNTINTQDFLNTDGLKSLQIAGLIFYKLKDLKMNRHFTKSALILLIGALGCLTSFAQSKTIKGVIKSADTQEPLQGVTIGIKGQAVGGTFTNSRGEFSLVVPSDKAV